MRPAAALALITSLSYGVSNYVGPSLSRGLPVYPVLIAGQVVAFAVSGAVLVVTLADLPSGTVVLAAAAAGLGNAFGLICFYRAASLGPLSIVTPIGSLAVLLPVTAGLASGEPLGAFKAGGDLAGGRRCDDRRAAAGRRGARGRRRAVGGALGAAVGGRLRHVPRLHRAGVGGRGLLGRDAQPRRAADRVRRRRTGDRGPAPRSRLALCPCSRFPACCCSPARCD